MRLPLLLSGVLHAAVVVLLYSGLPIFSDPELLESPPVIQLDIVVPIEDVTNLPPPEQSEEEVAPAETASAPEAATQPEPTQVEPAPSEPAPAEPDPAPTTVAALPPEPPSEPVPAAKPAVQPETPPEPVPAAEAPPPVPVPAPALKPETVESKPAEPEKPEVAAVPPKPAPLPAPKPKPAAKPQPAPKPVPDKKKFDPGQLAALLDKKLKEQPKKRSVEDTVQKHLEASSSQSNQMPQRMTISEIDALRQQVQRCWIVPAGARDAENLIVKIRFSLNPDGSVRGSPSIANLGDLQDEFHRIAAESALRAVLKCQPFKLPAEKYDRWRDIEMTFNPKEMLGG
ncbi:Filamentous hemagglutinin [Oceanibacterium hippocampi]|uniref:Filamentous hemagglutinin n=2 Tax=Oceanibacterium hippocampi TaxID=745714 RepID=A0A1Y5TXS8_9PROT|nr:Filamentous hemagglutinin [Oceanibacterium hippocampi]